MPEDYLDDKCPICNSKNIKWQAIEFADTQIGYPFKCNDCNVKLIAWYNLEFDIHTDLEGNDI